MGGGRSGEKGLVVRVVVVLRELRGWSWEGFVKEGGLQVVR